MKLLGLRHTQSATQFNLIRIRDDSPLASGKNNIIEEELLTVKDQFIEPTI